MTTFTFTNKETYLAYRSEWKANYKNLSQEIRTLKADIRETQQAKGYAGSMQYRLLKLRDEATAMIEERKASKVEAQRQYLAAHSEELVTA
jgi:hypothetical protein